MNGWSDGTISAKKVRCHCNNRWLDYAGDTDPACIRLAQIGTEQDLNMCHRNLEKELKRWGLHLKTNSEQSAFKNPLCGALKASNEDSLGHSLGTYSSQTFFFAAFHLQSPLQTLKTPWQNVSFLHRGPSKIGYDLTNANFNANESAHSNSNAI